MLKDETFFESDLVRPRTLIAMTPPVKAKCRSRCKTKATSSRSEECSQGRSELPFVGEVHRGLRRSLAAFRRGGYVTRMGYRQKQSAHVRARLITGEKTRKAGR